MPSRKTIFLFSLLLLLGLPLCILPGIAFLYSGFSASSRSSSVCEVTLSLSLALLLTPHFYYISRPPTYDSLPISTHIKHTHPPTRTQMARRAWEDVKLERRSPGGERVQSRRSSQEGNHRAQWVDRLDRGDERERQQSWFDSTANSCPSDKFGHSRSNSERNDGRDVRIMADITSAHHTGLERPNLSNWSAPSAIEARMLGIVDQYPSSPLKGRVHEDFASHRQSIDYGDGLQLPRSSALTSRLPQEIIDLILKLSRTQGRAQATAAERVRQLVHNKSVSGLIAKESWALEVMARVLIDGDNNARTSCCACFRHLALEDDGCGHMMASPIVLTGLVMALRVGDDAAKQKAAAALGNLAWRSEETRASISKIDGVVPGLLNLLHGNSVRSKESAMAALSNITLSSSCTLAVSKSMEALGVLCEELTSGTEKGKLRAAGIIRNLASEKSTRSSLLGFPGLVPKLEHVRRETHNTETMMRTEAALICLREETMLVAQQQQQSSRMLHSPGRARDSVASNAYGSGSSRLKYGNCSEEEALIKLDEWLLEHGWKDVQSHLFDAGYTRYEEFSAIEPHMMALDEAAGLYLYEGRALQLVGADRYNPTILIDIENRQVLWDFQSHTDFSNPWARQHFICKVEGRSSMILLKRTGKVVARHDSSSSNNNSISRGHKDPGETSVVDLEDSYLSEADRSRDKSPQSRPLVLNFAHPQQTPTPEPITSPSNKIATGFPSSTSQTGPRGWTPKIVAPDKSLPLLDELLRWGSAHGWHDIQRRLLDAGKTDYSRYAFYEKEMTPVPGEKDAFNFKGKKLRLVGINRQNPRRLFDDLTKEVLWDFEKATQFTFPWARQGLRIIKEPPIGPPKAGDKLKVVEKSSAIALIELEIPPAPLVNGKDIPAQPPVSKEVVANALRHGVSSLTHSKTPLSPSGPKPEVRPPSPVRHAICIHIHLCAFILDTVPD